MSERSQTMPLLAQVRVDPGARFASVTRALDAIDASRFLGFLGVGENPRAPKGLSLDGPGTSSLLLTPPSPRAGRRHAPASEARAAVDVARARIRFRRLRVRAPPHVRRDRRGRLRGPEARRLRRAARLGSPRRPTRKRRRRRLRGVAPPPRSPPRAPPIRTAAAATTTSTSTR